MSRAPATPYREVTHAPQEAAPAVGMDGLVEVQWSESELERQQDAAVREGWRTAIVLSSVFAAIFVGILIVFLLLML